MAASLLIRRGVAADIEPVSRLLTETWHHTYDALMGPEAVTRMTQAWHRPEMLARQLSPLRAAFLVAEDETEDSRRPLVGHAYARMTGKATLFLGRLYVHPDHQRRGIGTELLTHLLPLLPQARQIELSVVKQNAAAVDFYRRYEFEVVSESVDDGVALLLMRRRVTDPLSR